MSGCTSMGVTLKPCSVNALQQARPVERLTSRSADQPPSNTATCFAISLSLWISRPFWERPLRNSNAPDFPFERNAGRPEHPPAHFLAQTFDVGGPGRAMVDQEIAVHLGHLGIADSQPAAPGRVDQLPGFLPRRVLEGRAARPGVDRLGRRARLGDG